MTVIKAGIKWSSYASPTPNTTTTTLLTFPSVPNNIAVLDPSSQLVAFLRLDNAYLGSMDIAIKKAKTVTSFNGFFPSYGLQNRSEPGGDLWAIQETNGGLVVFGGGQPIYDHQGYWIGAVGISCGTVQQDVDTSIKAAESIGTTIKHYVYPPS